MLWRFRHALVALLITGAAPLPAAAQSAVARICPPVPPANNLNAQSSISADGRVVAFTSWASNLVPDDTNSATDIFVRDGQRTERVSVGPDGAQADKPSERTAVSGDGRYVGFSSAADNLVPGDTDRVFDVFVRDRLAGTTRRISLGARGQQVNADAVGPLLSADGQRAVFYSQSTSFGIGGGPLHGRIYLRDLSAGTTRQVALGLGGTAPEGESFATGLSADGRYLAFRSAAPNLVPGDTNREPDVFVEDLTTNQIRRVSLAGDGRELDGSTGLPALSADGTHVAFISNAPRLDPRLHGTTWGLVVRDLTTNHNTLVDVTTLELGADFDLTLDAHGRTLAWSATTIASNLALTNDIIVTDLATDLRQQLTHTAGGQGGASSAQLSADGTHLAFASADTTPTDTNNHPDIYLASHLLTRQHPPTLTIESLPTTDCRPNPASLSS